MDRCLLTFFIGALLSLFLPIVPDFSYVIFTVCLVFILLLFKSNHIVIALLLGAVWMLYQGATYNNNAKSLHSQKSYQAPVIVTGTVESLITSIKPHQGEKNLTQRFNFRINTINKKELEAPVIVRLSWQQPASSFDLNRGVLLKQNQQWQLPVKLKPAHGLSNVGGFNYQQWLRQHNVIATGYVRNKQQNNMVLLGNHISIRQQLFDRINKAINGSISKMSDNNRATFLALTFGVKTELTKEHWKILRATGTQHVIAISGLHIGLISATSYFTFLLFIRLLPLRLLPVFLQLKIQKVNIYYSAIGFSIFCAIFYSYLAGFSSPTLRACIMLAIFWLAKLFVIKLSKLRLLLLTLCFILIVQPMSLIGIGFWLSFYAVIIIFFIHWLSVHRLAKLSKLKRYIYSLVIIQLGLSLFILPVAALLNNELPLVAIVANLVIVPLVSFILLPCVLITFLSHIWFEFSYLFEVTNQLLNYFWFVLTWFSRIESTLLSLSYSQISLVLCSVILVLFSLLKVTRKRYFIGLSLLPLLLVFITKNSSFFLNENVLPELSLTKGERVYVNNGAFLLEASNSTTWQLHVFDVGQGLSVLIEMNGRAILYDTGASFASGFILSEMVVIPYLKSKGIEQLDAVFISHSDNDHAGGLSFLKKAIKVEQLIANDMKLLANNTCKQGDDFYWQGLQFSILWPDNETLGEQNDDSCVIHISDGKNTVLLTGDISKKVERILINNTQIGTNNIQGNLKANILVAPHHGSNTSSSSEFIQAVNPDYAVFSAGFMNRWNMPTEKVLQRYNALKVKHFNTAESGMVSFDLSKNEPVKVSEYKRHQYPFWFAN